MESIIKTAAPSLCADPAFGGGRGKEEIKNILMRQWQERGAKKKKKKINVRVILCIMYRGVSRAYCYVSGKMYAILVIREETRDAARPEYLYAPSPPLPRI